MALWMLQKVTEKLGNRMRDRWLAPKLLEKFRPRLADFVLSSSDEDVRDLDAAKLRRVKEQADRFAYFLLESLPDLLIANAVGVYFHARLLRLVDYKELAFLAGRTAVTGLPATKSAAVVAVPTLARPVSYRSAALVLSGLDLVRVYLRWLVQNPGAVCRSSIHRVVNTLRGLPTILMPWLILTMSFVKHLVSTAHTVTCVLPKDTAVKAHTDTLIAVKGELVYDDPAVGQPHPQNGDVHLQQNDTRRQDWLETFSL